MNACVLWTCYIHDTATLARKIQAICATIEEPSGIVCALQLLRLRCHHGESTLRSKHLEATNRHRMRHPSWQRSVFRNLSRISMQIDRWLRQAMAFSLLLMPE